MQGFPESLVPKTRTPNPLHDHVKAFCSSIVSDTVPVLLDNTPTPDARPRECFETVDKQVATHGGEVVYGWAVHEWPGVMIEAEFHAVWRDPQGKLRDISRQDFATGTTLFLIDPTRKFDGRQVNNIRRALRNHPAVHRYIKAANRMYEVMNAGDRAMQVGEIAIPANEIAPVMAEMAAAHLGVLELGQGRNDPCACGSGRKFKKCCGK